MFHLEDAEGHDLLSPENKHLFRWKRIQVFDLVDGTFKRREVDNTLAALDTTACDCEVYNVRESGIYLINIKPCPLDDAVNRRIDQNTMLIKWNEHSQDTIVSHFDSKRHSFKLSGFTVNGRSFTQMVSDTSLTFCMHDSRCVPRIKIDL